MWNATIERIFQFGDRRGVCRDLGISKLHELGKKFFLLPSRLVDDAAANISSTRALQSIKTCLTLDISGGHIKPFSQRVCRGIACFPYLCSTSHFPTSIISE